MTGTKISAMTAASALDGTESVPVVQSAANVKATVTQIRQATAAADTTDVFATKVTGDAANRFVVNADGGLEWGGGSGATDVTLFRSAADVLRTADSLVVAGSYLQAFQIVYASSGTHSFGWVAGSPEGVTTAPVGSWKFDTTNGVGYIKTLGTGNTGWCPVAGPQPINAQVGTSYTAVLADQGYLITCTNAAAIAFTIPANASVAYPVGTVIDIVQMGAGQVTIGITSDTVSGQPGLKIAAQYGRARIQKLTATTWIASGDLAA